MRAPSVALAGLALVWVSVFVAMNAHTFPQTLDDWRGIYGAFSTSGDAECQLCHADANGGRPWNAYGWDLRTALDDPSCDLDGGGNVSNDEAFDCVELLNSDEDTGGHDNLAEIVDFSSQPGWSLGSCNTLFDTDGETTGVTAPGDIGLLDPEGTEPRTDCVVEPPGPGPGPVVGRRTIRVRPGESIQAAIDRASPGTTILVEPGTYREHERADETNALTITTSGLRLIGLRQGHREVVLEPVGSQRNGIVVVPPERTECLSCHSTLAPPFDLLPGVEPTGETEPVIYGFDIQGFTIDGFPNNGLFTERVDGFRIMDVHSVDNRNYGIFPTLSSNGTISHSSATGSDDSGIWVETSENVRVIHNLVEGNVNGFEISNSDDILVANNEAVNNTVGVSLFVLTDLVDDRPGANRITVRNNWIHDNNKPNTGTPGSLLSFLPAGSGILHLGVDNSTIEHNLIENHDFTGYALVDYCLAVQLTPFNCELNPPPPEFDPNPDNNTIVNNTLIDNGTNPDPANPLAFAAADITVFLIENLGNCFERNDFSTHFFFGLPLPACEPGAP